MLVSWIDLFFFFNDTATTEIYTLSLHDALPISLGCTSSCVSRGSARRSASIRSRFACWTSRARSEEHTSELQSQSNLVCRLLLEKKNTSTNPLLTRATLSEYLYHHLLQAPASTS